jgi:hypothetical protein
MWYLPLFKWFDETWIGSTIRASTFAFPIIECVHLIGMVLLLGGLVVVDMRLLGLGMRRQPVSRVAAAMGPVSLIGLITMLATGIALFLSEALKCYGNIGFHYKMYFLFPGLVLYFTAHRIVTRRDDLSPIWGKVVALLSLGLWFGVALGGRAIGFV